MFTLVRYSAGTIVRHVQCHKQRTLPTFYTATRAIQSASSSPQDINKKQHLVIALGGNALLKRGEKLNIENQRKNIRDGIKSLSTVLKENKITFVNGNGPQVGLLALQGAAYQKETGTDTMELGK